jgi:hypothetical protein
MNTLTTFTTFTALLLAPLAALQAAVEPIPAFTTGARILFIGEARAANPNLKLVLCALPEANGPDTAVNPD